MPQSNIITFDGTDLLESGVQLDSVSGHLSLPTVDPINPEHVATKGYVDSVVAQQLGTATTLTETGGTAQWDMVGGSYYSLTLTADTALAAPQNTAVGMQGVLHVTQDAVGGRALTFDAAFVFDNGTAPTVTQMPSAEDVFNYFVLGPNKILLTLKAADIS